jgi:hypothetical protein
MLMFLLQEGPAQTTGYFIAGYVVIFGVMALYLASLVMRGRNLQRDLETLQEVQDKRS